MLPIVLAMAAAQTPRISGIVTGDFDHDGKPDRAMVLRQPDDTFAVVVEHGRGGRSMLMDHIRQIEAPFVKLASPGEIAAACSGSKAPHACPSGRLQLGDTISYGMHETTHGVALWNGRSFELILIGGVGP